MNTVDLIEEIQRLPIHQRIDILEAVLSSIKKNQAQEQLEQACATLYDDYAANQDLIAFTALDFEDFYEPK